MTTPDPRQVAEGLTAAQRRAVLRLPEHGGYIWMGHISIRKPTADMLASKGVFSGDRDYWRVFTDFGLQVRAILQESENVRS